VSIRRPHWRERLGRLAAAAGGLLVGLLLVALLLGMPGCARYSTGFYHQVRPGENLYRIGLHYGIPAEQLARINGVRDVTSLRVGQRLWIPKERAGNVPSQPRTGVASTTKPPSKASSSASAAARQAARREAEQNAHVSFGWPIQNPELSSRFGRRWGRPHEGVDFAAAQGTRILAAEAGKVTHSGRLGDYGNVVILKHAGNYRTVYAHARKLLVKRGQFVDKGERIAEVGSTGRASGPHLHFEIRERETPRDPMLYLP
jgi:murein DD-endopeptidase MepM/ murein hydrolase activator NlpD